MSTEDFIHPNLKQMSHSSDDLLDKCPRKYQLYKTGAKIVKLETVEDKHLAFGRLVGGGIETWLITKDLVKTHFSMFVSWDKMIDDEDGALQKKTFWHGLVALDKFATFFEQAFPNHELVHFDNKPAVELGFTIDCGDGFVYRGKLDALLIDTRTGELVVLECKTTGFRNVHEAMYKHSGQGLGYGLITDAIAHLIGSQLRSSYKVKYVIYKTSAYEWELLPFTKSRTERALWIKQMLIRKVRISEFVGWNYFPMHGWNCYDFFRPCAYFGICDRSDQLLIGDIEKVPVKEDNPEDYPFKFNLEEIIEAQLAIQGD